MNPAFLWALLAGALLIIFFPQPTPPKPTPTVSYCPVEPYEFAGDLYLKDRQPQEYVPCRWLKLEQDV